MEGLLVSVASLSTIGADNLPPDFHRRRFNCGPLLFTTHEIRQAYLAMNKLFSWAQ